jgi:hypothetical protein
MSENGCPDLCVKLLKLFKKDESKVEKLPAVSLFIRETCIYCLFQSRGYGFLIVKYTFHLDIYEVRLTVTNSESFYNTIPDKKETAQNHPHGLHSNNYYYKYNA